MANSAKNDQLTRQWSQGTVKEITQGRNPGGHRWCHVKCFDKLNEQNAKAFYRSWNENIYERCATYKKKRLKTDVTPINNTNPYITPANPNRHRAALAASHRLGRGTHAAFWNHMKFSLQQEQKQRKQNVSYAVLCTLIVDFPLDQLDFQT
jgi:hypothetical protein